MRIATGPRVEIKPWRPPGRPAAPSGDQPTSAAAVIAALAGYTSLPVQGPPLPAELALPHLTISADQATELIRSYGTGMECALRAGAGQPGNELALLRDASKLEEIVQHLIKLPHNHVAGLVCLAGVLGGLAAQAAGAGAGKPLLQRAGRALYDSTAFAQGVLSGDARGLEGIVAAAGLLDDVLVLASNVGPAAQAVRAIDASTDLIERLMASQDTLATTLHLASLQLEAASDPVTVAGPSTPLPEWAQPLAGVAPEAPVPPSLDSRALMNESAP